MSLLMFATAASEIGKQACAIAGAGAVGCETSIFAKGGFVNNAIDTVIMIIGALSVLMVIIGGLRYVLSGGDSAGIKSAKDTVMYALIGLAVALLSYALVGFVIKRVG